MKVLKTLMVVGIFSLCCALTMTKTGSMEERFIKAGHAELFCRVSGQGDPILVLHGGPGLSHDYLLPEMTRLSKNHRVIFYDQRACGRSTGEISSDTIQIDLFLEDIERIRQAFGLKKMTVLGHSWGGFLAMHYAISHPESVDKLILLNTLPSSADGVFLFLKEWVSRMDPYQNELKRLKESQEFLNGDPSTIAQYYRIIFRTYCHDPEKANLLSLVMSPKASLDGFKVNGIFRESVFTKPFNLQTQLKQLNVPTLIIHGDHDPIPPVTVEEIHKSILNSRYILLKDCGHFPYIEMPDVMFGHIEAFLQPKSTL